MLVDWSAQEIHVHATETPQPFKMGKQTWSSPRGGEDDHQDPRRGEPPLGVARGLLAATPAEGMGAKKGAEVGLPAAQALPRDPTASTMAAGSWQRPKMGRKPQSFPPKATPTGLEIPHAAQERPSCGSDQSPPMATSRTVREAASWCKTPRPSAGRPRKVSQGSAAASQEHHEKQGQGWENGEARSQEKTRHHHGGQKTGK